MDNLYFSDHSIMVDLLTISFTVDEVISYYNLSIPPLNAKTLEKFEKSLQSLPKSNVTRTLKESLESYKALIREFK